MIKLSEDWPDTFLKDPSQLTNNYSFTVTTGNYIQTPGQEFCV